MSAGVMTKSYVGGTRPEREARRGRPQRAWALASFLCVAVLARNSPGEERPGSFAPGSASPNACQPASPEGGPANAELTVGALLAESECWLAAREYDRALSAIERACTRSDLPSCLFNRAFVHHAMLEVPGELDQEHCRVSRESYERYLLLDPYGSRSDEAAGAVRELEQICASEHPALAAAAPAMSWGPDVIRAVEANATVGVPSVDRSAAHPTPTERQREPPPAHAATQQREAMWLFFGAGAATSLATVVSWKQLSNANSDLVARAPQVERGETESLALDRKRRSYQIATWGLGLGSAVLWGAGVRLLLLEAGSGGGWFLGADGAGPGLSYRNAF
jgi:hypothetical protein